MENLRSARRSPFVISKVLSAHMRKFITARTRKNKRTARMLANARKRPFDTPSRRCFIKFPKIDKFVKNTPLRVVLFKLFSHNLEIYVVKQHLKLFRIYIFSLLLFCFRFNHKTLC